LSREPSINEPSQSAVGADYFSTNPHEAGSNTGVFDTPLIQEESHEYYEPITIIPEVKPTFASPLLPLLSPSLAYREPTEPPSDSSTDTKGQQSQTMAHALMDVQLQAIMTAAIRAVNGDEKNLKTPEQKQFLGRAEDLANFLQECDLRFTVFSTTYSTATKKVFYALSLMTTGTAKVWKDAFINERQVVLESLVQSGLLPIFGKTETETSL